MTATPTPEAVAEMIANLRDPFLRLGTLLLRNDAATMIESLSRAQAEREAELAAARKDAERYCFWRKFYDCRFALKLGGTRLTLSFRPARPDVEVSPDYERLVDAALDAAIASAQAKEGE